MKIILVNNLFSPYSRGGAERITELIARESVSRGIETIIISTKPRGDTLKNNDFKMYYLNSAYYNLGKIPYFLRYFWHFFDTLDFINYFKIKRILKKEKPDLVITNNLKGIGYLTIKAIKNSGIKNFHILHDVQLLEPSGIIYFGNENQKHNALKNFYISINNRLFGACDLVISPSNWLLEEHKKLGFFKNCNAIVMSNPLIEPKEKIIENKKDKSEIILLYIGLIEKHKGILLLISAFKDLIEQKKIPPQSKLLIAGNGGLLNFLKKENKDSNSTIFLGRLNSSEVENAMQKSDLLVVPSLCYENSPTVIFEALANGVPAIASKIGGIPEIIQKYGGLLFTVGNKADLMDKISYAIANINDLNKIANTNKNKLGSLSVQNYLNKLMGEYKKIN